MTAYSTVFALVTVPEKQPTDLHLSDLETISVININLLLLMLYADNTSSMLYSNMAAEIVNVPL